MDPTRRKELTLALSKLTGAIASELRQRMLGDPDVERRARALKEEERTGTDFAVWTDLLSRRAAVLWVLKTLYVRVLEDRGLLAPLRIVDQESQALFARLAPSLGDTAYLEWVFRDLASEKGGLPELFLPQPAEIVRPPDALSLKLIEFWRERSPDTGELRWRFDDEHFDSRLMGDLYQDLDPVVKKRYALLQTPDFIIDFILDETLTPAIAEWGVETVRVLDPACGSGHFLLAAFKRLFEGMRAKYPSKRARELVEDVLRRVVGIDLNDYACALARARLVMTALEACGENSIDAGATFHPQVFWADALEQVERDEWQQGELAGMGASEARSPRTMNRPEVRAALRPVLERKFHVVVGNPPFDVERDAERREYHRQIVQRRRRYESAAGKYSLGPVFGERFFQLALLNGQVGLITANSFLKRKFGKAFVEKTLARIVLTKVVDASAVVIPGAGIRSVILFARNRSKGGDGVVRVVMGKRAEPNTRGDPAVGQVWRSILDGHVAVGFENEFVSVADVPRSTMAKHPWSIGGGGAAELKECLDRHTIRLREEVTDIGFASFPGADDVFVVPREAALRHGIPVGFVRPLIPGDSVRNWAHQPGDWAIAPYDADHALVSRKDLDNGYRYFWHVRSAVLATRDFGEVTRREAGDSEWAWYRWIPERYRKAVSIAFADVATHNHFVLDRGGKVFNRTAPVIKLPWDSSEAQHLVLLGQLNCSTVCFWLKQVCHSHGEGGGSRVEAGHGILGSEDWKNHYAHDAHSIGAVPLALTAHPLLESFAGELDALARSRVDNSARATVDAHAASGVSALRDVLSSRRARDLERLYRMVGLQEELDWLCYKLYGIDADVDVREPNQVPPLTPGFRPFEITLAREDAERREALARGEEPDEAPTAWFERHGWTPHTTLDTLDPEERAVVAARIERTEASRELSLVEQPTYKRRWYRPDYDKEEREALEAFFADRLEDWTKNRKEPWTTRQAASALGADPSVLSVAELLESRSDFDLDALVAKHVRLDAVPNNKHHVYKPEGLLKRAAWEETWRLQHLEDAGQKVTPPVPPKYASTDFLKTDSWRLRGKLDVPKERFIAFTEVPGADGDAALFGWAGWTPRERCRALLALDEQLEASGTPVADRHGLLYGVWFLLPYVAWESESAAQDFRADVRSLVGEGGVTDAMLAEWAKRFPPPGSRGKKNGSARRK